MATLTFTLPDAALARLDAYAQRRNYADFRTYAITWMKNSAHIARQEENARSASDLLSAPITDPNIV